MQRALRLTINLIFSVQVLLLFLLFFEDRVELPAWLQVAGRMHPMVLHLPIGILILLFVFILLRNTFQKKQFHKILLVCLAMASLSAAVTALFGFFLSIGGDYGAETLQRHKISGIVLSVLTFFILLWYQNVKKGEVVFYLSTILSTVLLVIAGHTGSILTHGENYVFEPVSSKAESEIDVAKVSLYEVAVMPVLERKCFSCHNASKAKGKLIMTDMTKFQQGGENGRPWVAGSPDSSRMIQYIHLPLKDDNHMPPDGKPQLTPFEITLLSKWIKSGADFEKRYAEYPDGDSLKLLATAIINSRTKPEEESAYTFKAASAEVIQRLNTPFRTVFPLYQNSPALQADFFVKESFKLNSLEELKEIREQLVVLNLARMPITDTDLKMISQFKNLEKLNLNFTAVKGNGLAHLKSLEHLESVSLSGNPITMEALKSMLGLPALTEVFIWNTAIREDELSELKKANPKIEIIHTLFTDNSLLALSKPILVNEGILKTGELLQLKHTMPGVDIRYTIDGSKPDSVSGIKYEKPIEVTETVKLKAIACKEGWYCSKLLEVTCFVEGKKPMQAMLLSPPDKQYPGEGASSLTDGRKGFTDVLKEPSWLGFRENAFEAGFDFGSAPPELHKVVMSYCDNLGGYIFPPVEVEVWGGNNQQQLTKVATVKVEQPVAYRSQSMQSLDVPFNSSRYSFYKVVAKPVAKLPQWHNGKGQKGWFFVDEVFFY